MPLQMLIQNLCKEHRKEDITRQIVFLNTIGTFRSDYEYEIEYEYDFSILVFRLHIITTHTHFIP